MLVEGGLQLLVGVNEALHGLIVRARVAGDHVSLYASRGAQTAVGKLLYQVIVEYLGVGRVHDDLLQELGRGPGLFESAGKLDSAGQFIVGVVSRKVVLAVAILRCVLLLLLLLVDEVTVRNQWVALYQDLLVP